MAAQDRGQLVEPGGAAGAREAHPFQPGERLQADAVGTAQLGGPLGGEEHAEPLPGHEHRVELVPGGTLPEQAHVELAGLQRGHLRRRGQMAGLHAGAGVGHGELLQRRSEQVGRQLKGNPHPQVPAVPARIRGHRPQCPVVPGEYGTRLGEQRHPRLGGPHSGAAADQQFHPQPALQHADGLRQRGLTDVQPTRRGRHAPSSATTTNARSSRNSMPPMASHLAGAARREPRRQVRADHGRRPGESGSRRTKHAPPHTDSSTWRLPSWAEAMPRATARPRPTPPRSRLRAASNRAKR